MNSITQQISLELDSNVWTEALSEELGIRGFPSLTAYADSQPMATLAELAHDLGGPGISSTLLEQQLVAEAEATGTMERCARSLLARDLRAEVPEGWRPRQPYCEDEAASQSFRINGVFLALSMGLPEAYQDAIDRVQRAFATAKIPDGWVPEGGDDIVLIEIFASYWHLHHC